ncbi:MAG: MerR family transcriptional regulator [Clostridia bacterium]|jgi:Predicted transcriptional regulators
MAEHWMTITEIAQQLNLPETTVRRYARVFADYIRSKTVGRTTRYPSETVQLFAQISELFRQGYTSRDVAEWLQRKSPKTIVVAEEENNHHPPPPVEAVVMLVEAQNKLIDELKTEVTQLRKELEAARQEIAATKQEIAATIERGVKDVKETLSRIERRRQEEQAKPWWRRLFK